MEDFVKKFFYYFKWILIGGIIIEILGFIWYRYLIIGLVIITLFFYYYFPFFLQWCFIEWILGVICLFILKKYRHHNTWLSQVLSRKIGRILIIFFIFLLFTLPFYRPLFGRNISEFLFFLEELILLVLVSYWVGNFIKEKHWKEVSKTIIFCLINFFIIAPIYAIGFLGAPSSPVCGEAYYNTFVPFSKKTSASFKGDDFKEWFLKNGFKMENVFCSFDRGYSDSIEIKGKQSCLSILKFGEKMKIWIEFNFDGVKLTTPPKLKIQKCEEIFKLKWKAKRSSVEIYISNGSKIEYLIIGAKMKGKLKKLGFNFPRPYLGESLERPCD